MLVWKDVPQMDSKPMVCNKSSVFFMPEFFNFSLKMSRAVVNWMSASDSHGDFFSACCLRNNFCQSRLQQKTTEDKKNQSITY
jgi:hypothetical protein